MSDLHLNLNSLQQLFHSLDPSPFREKALDVEAEAYLVALAKELPGNEPLRLVVHGPESLRASLPDIASGISTHFRLAEEGVARGSRFRRRIGWRALAAALAILGLALGAHHVLQGRGPWAQVVGEGLIIVGWVVLWRPSEILLFDWFETSEERSVLRRLAEMPATFQASVADPGASGHA